MTTIRLAGILATGALALAALSGCDVASRVPTAQPLPSPSTPRQACQRIYDPVCAGRYGEERTFPNACEAGVAGYSIHYGGQCRAGTNGGQPGGGFGGASGAGAGGPQSTPAAPSSEASGQMCAMIFKPVCGRRGNDTRTFPNSCQAANSGYRVITHSECLGKDVSGSAAPSAGGGSEAASGGGGQAEDRQANAGKSCSRAFVPVCGSRGGKKKTFINACMAAADGYSVAAQGRCE